MNKKEDIIVFEKIASHVHPPLKQESFDGWNLGFSEGYSRRANSVLAFEKGSVPVEEKIVICEEKYEKEGLPCIFKMTEAFEEGLQAALEKKGYILEAPTSVMLVEADSPVLYERFETIEEPDDIGVIITGAPDEAWLNPFFDYENRTDSKIMEIIKRQFQTVDENESLNALYCRIQILGQDVAVASAVIENGVLFLLNVVVNPQCRGKGYGKILIKEILEASLDFGAEKLCLQVMQDNLVAINMYKTFGFDFYYKYWFMVKQLAG